jgi:HAD superfamily hydrolase (TIGR01509 family)
LVSGSSSGVRADLRQTYDSEILTEGAGRIKPMMRPQAMVFDMDGVLIDSEELHAHAKRIAFAHAGIALSDADLRSYVGRSDAVMIDEMGARYGLTDGQRSTVVNEKMRIYEQEEEGIKIVSGAIEFVRWAAQHYRLALATSATRRNRMTTLNRLGIADLFEVTVDLGDVSEPKPSPEIYLTVTSRLALHPSQCLVVEDSLTGVISAKQAGCCVSALTRSFAEDELISAGADFIFEDFQSLKWSAEIEKYCR